MKKTSDASHDPRVDRALVAADPAASLVARIASQLVDHLPIKDAAQLKRCATELGTIELGGHKLHAAGVLPLVPNSIFPVETVDDLVRQLRGAVNFAHVAVARGLAAHHPEMDRLARAVAWATLPPPAGAGVGVLGRSQPNATKTKTKTKEAKR